MNRDCYSSFLWNNVHWTNPLAIRYEYMISVFSHLRTSSFTTSYTFELSLLLTSLMGLNSSSRKDTMSA